jgi:acetyltransferase-like isoleucine patch superfamily enzyme
MHYAGFGFWSRIATRLAACSVPPYYGRCYLAGLNQKGYVAPTARIHHNDIIFGKNIFIGERVIIYNYIDGGRVELGDRAHLYGETYVLTAQGGNVRIGSDTYIQPGCQLSAVKGSIYIGSDVQIASGCAFYPYDHGILPGELISKQPLTTKGNIEIEDDTWLGFGVIVLSGVRIGKGAVIGAGSVVTHSVPDQAIAVGVPARIVAMRS